MPALSRLSQTLLLVSIHDPSGLNTIRVELHEWATRSEFNIVPLNLHPTLQEFGVRIPPMVELDGIDGIIIHSSVAYFPHNLRRFLQDLRDRGVDDRAVVLYKQDEHVNSHETAKLIGEFEIELLLTCVPQSERAKVYPASLVGDVSYLQVRTGYVTDSLLRAAPEIPWGERSVDVFYRGSMQPPEIGELGFLKQALARRAREAGGRLGLRVDASAAGTDLIFGSDWLKRLGDARATVSVESGSNLFDFDGSHTREIKAFLEANPDIDPYSDAGYALLVGKILHLREGNVQYGQVAPRHLEAAATRTPQLLVPGAYSGMFRAGDHYLELQPDFTDFEERWNQLKMHPIEREAMIERAYEEIARNPAYHIAQFVRSVDESILAVLRPRGTGTWSGKPEELSIPKFGRPLILVLCPHVAARDPRIGWWKDAFPDARVDVIDADQDIDERGGVLGGVGGSLITARASHGLGCDALPADVLVRLRANRGLGVLREMEIQARTAAAGLAEPSLMSDSQKWLFAHTVRYSVGLVEAASRLRSVDAVLVADMPALPAGVILSEVFDVPLIYDAQELWGHDQPTLTQGEIEWWDKLEASLLGEVDVRVTVSPGLAQWYLDETGFSFTVVPNFVPLEPDLAPADLAPNRPVRFGFLGNFAPRRGLEELIDAWDLPPEIATLHLQGPDSPYRDRTVARAREQNKFGTSIHFPTAVAEGDIVAAMSQYHVGVIPYVYTYPYSHCSPNKLGQYAAAGCAVISHELPFVMSVIKSGAFGDSFNFRDKDGLPRFLAQVAANRVRLQEWRRNARDTHLSTMNWTSATAEVRAVVTARIGRREISERAVVLPPAPSLSTTIPYPSQGRGARDKSGCQTGPSDPMSSERELMPTRPSGLAPSPYSRIAHFVKRHVPKTSPLYDGVHAAHRILRRVFQ